MSFREKIAWLSVTTTVIVWGTYFGFLLTSARHLPPPGQFGGFFAAVVVQTILVIAGSVVTAILSPSDAGAPRDERDRAVSHGAYALAYPVLLSLIVCIAASLYLGVDAQGMTYEIMAAIVIAEIVHYGAQIVGYRRGA
ncbi:MAG: hypothetical protein ACTHJR_18965 [Sphingomonas sp.]|uniref:hypothetical protein n=1 Tax=Sphingomonas sp. TaxID=28214 RepID=UPI003F7D39B2